MIGIKSVRSLRTFQNNFILDFIRLYLIIFHNYLQIQCPAVNSHLSLITVAPHWWVPCLQMLAAQGNSAGRLSIPPTIRPFRAITIPHSTSATIKINISIDFFKFPAILPFILINKLHQFIKKNRYYDLRSWFMWRILMFGWLIPYK